MTVTDTPRAPLFHCLSCGEPLYGRTSVCPHCGARDPVGAEAGEVPPSGAPAEMVVDDVVVAAPTTGANPAPEVAVPLPGGETAPPVAAAADDPLAEPAPVADGSAPVEPVADETAAGDRSAAVGGPDTGPAVPRAGAMLDITPEPRDGPEPEESTRELALIPIRGSRELAIPQRRRSRLAGALLAIIVVAGLAALGLLGWRQLGPLLADEQSSREVTVGHDWRPLDLDAGRTPGGEWTVTSTGPFRIRVDGAVYTVAGPIPFAIPLDGRAIEVRAVGSDVKLTLTRR